MRRGSLAYPLQRGADSDQGGAAELQTDVMRFMAILSLCLVAIFALVQSLPVTPAPAPTPAAVPPAPPKPEPVAQLPTRQPVTVTEKTTPAVLTVAPPAPVATPTEPAPSAAGAVADTAAATPAAPERGFTLRFASDAALMQTVAARRVGLYAISQQRALRMAVSESRISFWDASMPGAVREMEPTTVPAAVSEALQRAGVDAATVTWGVTLPGRLTSELDQLMQLHDDGALVIDADGSMHREAR